ncbi:hypothetical protein ACLKA6_004081 [Drosophila palustris]
MGRWTVAHLRVGAAGQKGHSRKDSETLEALTSQLELIELNEIKEFHAETNEDVAGQARRLSWGHSFCGAPGIYGSKIYEPQQGRRKALAA